MKTIFLSEIGLQNFRGHGNFTAQLGQSTQVIGDNREGKSTIFDAFLWLLFGKDQFGRQDFEITPIVDGERLERVDSEVFGLLDVDGVEVQLRRVYHQKWVRRRGTSQEVFDGYETQYWIDGVPKKAGEYKTFIDSIVGEQIFKLITSPGAFFALPWKQQRDFLFEVAGTVTNAEIAAGRPEFANLLDQISGKSFEDFKKELSARKRKLKEELAGISPRIDQIAKMAPEAKNWAALEKKIAEIDSRVAEIDEHLADRAKAVQSLHAKNEERGNEISRLKTKQREIVTAANVAAEESADNDNKARREMAGKVAAKKDEATKAAKQADGIAEEKAAQQAKIHVLNTEIEALRENWAKENAKEYNSQSGCLVCPVFGHNCGDPTAAGKHVEAQEKAVAAFNDNKSKRLAEIQKDGQGKSQKVAALQAVIANLTQEESGARTKAAELMAEGQRLQKELDTMPAVVPAQVIPDSLPEWVKLAAEIARIESEIKPVEAPDNSEAVAEKKTAGEWRDKLKSELADRELIARYNAETERLKEEAGELSQQIADIEKMEFSMDEFNRVRIEEAESRINGLFEITKFKLFDKTNNGDEFECCIPQNKKGVPIAATNTAEQINAGLDVINTLSNFHNVTAPIFVDRAESVTKFVSTPAQLIQLVVMKGQKLTVIK